MQADLNALRRLFDAVGIPVTVCQGAAVTRRYIAENLARHDFIYYLGHAKEGELLLGGDNTLSVGDLLPLPEGRASCVFINGCRSGGASADGLGIAQAIGRTVNAGCVVAPAYAVGYELAGKAACAFFGQLLANKSAGKAMEEMRRQVGGPGEGYVLFCNYPGMDFAHRGGLLQLAKAALPALAATAGLSMILLRGGEEVPYRLAVALAACLPGALAASFLYYQWGYYRCRQLPAVCLLLISLVLVLPGAATAAADSVHRIVLCAAYVASLLIYTVLICNYRLLVGKERMRP